MEVQPRLQDYSSPPSPISPGLNTRLRAELNALSNWRVDLKRIVFETKNTSKNFQGGFATVYRASLVDDTDRGPQCHRKDVAVKKMKINDPEERDKVLGLALREARFLIDLSHENIVELRGFAEDITSHQIWLILPWAANGNLRDFTASADWEVPERIWLIHDVASGIQYLHDQDPPIYHGDLKSVNILVSSEHRAVITDFGSARRAESKNARPKETILNDGKGFGDKVLEASVDAAANAITLTSNNFTLRWAAPEVLAEEEGAGTEGDMWSFGWVCYEVMTGEIPFSETMIDTVVILRIVNGELPRLNDHTRMMLIRDLASIMVMCWMLSPPKRPSADRCIDMMKWMPRCPPRSRDSASNRTVNASLKLGLGRMHYYQSEYSKATAEFQEALKIATNTNDKGAKADALRWLAEVHNMQSQYVEALELFNECLGIRREVGDLEGQADALLRLAEVSRPQAENTKAVELYSECIRIGQEINNGIVTASAMRGLAEVYQIMNEERSALEMYQSACDLFNQVGWTSDALDALHQVSRIRRRLSLDSDLS